MKNVVAKFNDIIMNCEMGPNQNLYFKKLV